MKYIGRYYIVQNYDTLPDRIAFVHGHEKSWHTEVPNYDLLNTISWSQRQYQSLTQLWARAHSCHFRLSTHPKYKDEPWGWRNWRPRKPDSQDLLYGFVEKLWALYARGHLDLPVP